MIRFTYPRSFLSLLLIGFSLVAAPLVFALFSNVLAFERLAALSEQAVHSAVRVTQASRSLLGVITRRALGAAYAVGASHVLEAYRSNRQFPEDNGPPTRWPFPTTALRGAAIERNRERSIKSSRAAAHARTRAPAAGRFRGPRRAAQALVQWATGDRRRHEQCRTRRSITHRSSG